MRRVALSISLAFATILNALAWGQKGHDIINYIAECHLDEEVLAEVEELLDGRSIVYWGNWADSAKYTEEYKYTAPWHHRNVEQGESCESTPTTKGGDVVWAVKEMVTRLKDTTQSREDHALCLKLLIHLVGDLHSPMHAGRREDLGGNRVPMVFFYEATNLHAIWDSKLIERVHTWSYTEWQQQIDRLSADSVEVVVSGSVDDWFMESYDLAVQIYADARRRQDENFDYCDKYQLPLETQLRNGGLRLAYILNDIYRK